MRLIKGRTFYKEPWYNSYREVNGERMTLSQCAYKYGFPKSTVRYWANKYGDVLTLTNCGADMKGDEDASTT